MLFATISISIMSGVDDGTSFHFEPQKEGKLQGEHWILSVGRQHDNDLCLNKDTFVSRYHAHIHWNQDQWWLQDLESTNGTFTENELSLLDDSRVYGTVPLVVGQLFRIGRTWLRIEGD